MNNITIMINIKQKVIDIFIETKLQLVSILIQVPI